MSKWASPGVSESSDQYPAWMIGLHWLTAALVITAYLTSESSKSGRVNPPFVHLVAGLAVLGLTIPRLITRLFGGGLPSTGATQGISSSGHAVIYFLLVAVPMTGWFAVSRLGVHVTLLCFHLPFLTAPVTGPPGMISNVHQVGGNLLLIIAGFHAALALWNFFRVRDTTLQRMLPFLRQR